MMKSKMQAFIKDERGEFGIKQIAGLVAVLVFIGIIVTTISGLLPDWIAYVWGLFTTWVDKQL
ncbi:hypothetical protein I6N90_19825 [Paenibacillus sp. GSMTC-2017]|uniref:hypothetical protein n=1 Tax=Paenibacillus sp. GSMTC-2017 TaxID=2794350 RepID=UPI0018D7F3D6|nr:hypothetical protein [Paenibacillus sp. GSMTC-2017]MBH5320055.1 hypothetical protein [Paenibacillus sp. GSMTC-2017]